MQWKKHFTAEQWLMEHERAEDFACSCWQRGRSPLPLLLWRAVKLLWIVGICGWSYNLFEFKSYYFIYMTHWGLITLTLQAIFGVAISVAACLQSLPDPSHGLPWYVKTYWVLMNISAPVAFLISLFYWIILHGNEQLSAFLPNKYLDVSLHALNSAAMLLELMTAAHPSRLLHVYQPVGFSLTYLIFGLVYYLAGGRNSSGGAWIYPMIDWSKPGPTIGVLAATTAALLLLHAATVGLASLRDALAHRLLRPRREPHSGASNGGFVAA